MNNPYFQMRCMPTGDVKQTEKGNRYRTGSFLNGGTALLFPRDNGDRTVSWFAPFESQIFDTDDKELISIYKDIDNINKYNYHMFGLNYTKVVKGG